MLWTPWGQGWSDEGTPGLSTSIHCVWEGQGIDGILSAWNRLGSMELDKWKGGGSWEPHRAARLSWAAFQPGMEGPATATAEDRELLVRGTPW